MLTLYHFADKFPYGSAKVTGGPLGLQIRCGALKPSRVGSIPMHFRHNMMILLYIVMHNNCTKTEPMFETISLYGCSNSMSYFHCKKFMFLDY